MALRQTFFAALALVTTLTGIAAAQARGQMAADGVICGTGAHAIVLAADGLPLFDGSGAPVEVGTLPCLDCTFAALGPVPDRDGPVSQAGSTGTLASSGAATATGSLRIMGGKGRGPPGMA